MEQATVATVLEDAWAGRHAWAYSRFGGFCPHVATIFLSSSQLSLIPSYMHVTIDVQATIAISEKCSVRYSKIVRYRLAN